MNEDNIYIGLMSGTSLDSVDAVAANFSSDELELMDTYNHPIPQDLRADILNLCQPGRDTLQLYAQTDSKLGELFADSVLTLVDRLSLKREQVKAIGCHGQTIRHAPPRPGSIGFSQQIGDANIIAVRTGMLVVTDFRRKDIALGGQGAPLVPAFHRKFFSSAEENRLIVNIGGITNITLLTADGNCLGFDTGPGNVLLDSWSQKHLGTAYDNNGSWAASGSPNSDLLQHLKSQSFFAQSPPKSTGRELFNQEWLETQLQDYPNTAHQDVQATLLALTAETLADAIHELHQSAKEMFVCGGGAFNHTLMAKLKKLLPQITVSTTTKLGIDPCWVEACAFAWLAKQRIEHKSSNLMSVTGASRGTVLGGVYLP